MSSSIRASASPSRRPAIALRVLRIAFIVVLLGVLLSLAGLFFSAAILTVEQTPTSADAIVILGGEHPLRPKRAIEIYRHLAEASILDAPHSHSDTSVKTPNLEFRTESDASQSSTGVPPTSVPSPLAPQASPHSSTPPFFVATGLGDCEPIARVLSAAGVPTNCIILECASRSTWENAAFSIPLLRDHHATNVIIVTSWFHSRRALNCFRKQAPDLHVISAPTVEDRPRAGWPNRYDRSRVLLEYAKTTGYWLRYGVCPW